MMRDDEPILEYLRSRARARPPIDLVGSIADAVADVPQRRHSWFAPFVPAIAVAGAAAAVVGVAVLVGGDREIGPPTGGSPTQLATPSASPLPTGTSAPMPLLLEPGATATFDATDPAGSWGTVTLTRGDDVGGYDDGSVPADSFVVEIHVEYVAERTPDPNEFGRPDWALRVAGGDPLPTLAAGGRREATRPTLATYPGAIDIFTNPLEGWLLFEVPRSAASAALELTYQPRGVAAPVTTARIRDGGTPPDPVAAATPAPTPAAVTYVELDPYPFTVIESAEADELFSTPDTCTNPVAGYTVTYPDAWFTNTEIGDWAACTWFSPVFFSVGDDPNEVPPQVAIVVVVVDGPVSTSCEPPSVQHMAFFERLPLAARETVRWEQVGCTDGDGGTTPRPPSYEYHVGIEETAATPDEARTFIARTSFEGAADYELNKAVLDRIMGLIELDEPGPAE